MLGLFLSLDLQLSEKVVFVFTQRFFDKFQYRLCFIVYFPLHLFQSLSQYVHFISQYSDSTPKVAIESFELFREIMELMLVHTLSVFSCCSELDLSYDLLQVCGAIIEFDLVLNLLSFQSSKCLLLCGHLRSGRPNLIIDNVPYEYL